MIRAKMCTDQVAAIVKQRCAAVGLDPALYSAPDRRVYQYAGSAMLVVHGVLVAR